MSLRSRPIGAGGFKTGAAASIWSCLTGGCPAAPNSLAMYVVRVMRGIAGEVRDVARGRTPTHARLRDSLVGVALATIGVDLICGVLALVFEHNAKQTQIMSFGSALFWTSTQLLTVSS